MSHLYKFHYLKGKYHSAIKEWQTSINNYDSLLFRANHFGVNGRVFISLNLLKSEALYNNGNKMEAAMLLDSLYLARDSILSNMIQVQEKILAQNYIMNKALVRAESIKTFFSITSIVGVVLLIFMLSFLIFQSTILLR